MWFLIIVCLLVSQALKETIEQLKERERYYGVFTSETEFSEYMTEIHKDLVAIHGEMVLLKTYSSLNFAGKEAASYIFLLYLERWVVVLLSFTCFLGLI